MKQKKIGEFGMGCRAEVVQKDKEEQDYGEL
jgi:hypothetical protein